tara:strand:+ start:436 stop:897 length:462 start_codon:yes stop_codon:yes gene_type:complete
MGTKITKGYNFGPTEQVTATKLHLLVSEATLQVDSVGTPELAMGSVSTAKLAALSVETDKIGVDAVTGDQIADATIGLEHFAPSARPITYDFGYATALRSGHRGLVPAPTTGQNLQFLRADGWQSIIPQVTETVDAAVQISPGIAFHNHANFS